MVPWGLIALVVGFIYGWASPGRQNKAQLFKTGLLWGVVIALVLGLLGILVDANPLDLGRSVIGMIIGIAIILLLFVLGVWLGDLVEGAQKRRKTA